ncbi:hypothetical protein ACFO25_05360 [Paenactinomyces guangxiensis]|uniref:Uncharacterized protein n=1 Tax=Paenactinomyces guangxiensis TaxID=1490290 RepID=A0A7W1WR11_9BACL|nr:hypothetical protein [Paenactinomyces guangxiensis]MBA4494339.1 hypothetical protein [Paenactinomyces guangxiensis]MBH8590834.1 hypothetical protein [Paenactinomyces guangxiensis]
MKKIQGSQLPLPPNNAQEECIRVQKVYDWVIFANVERNKAPIPAECLEAVEAALQNGDALRVDVSCPAGTGTFPLLPKPQPEPVPGQPSCRVVQPIRRITIPSPVTGTPVEVAIVRILFLVPVTISIFNETAPTPTQICPPFVVPVRFSDDVVLCLPQPLNEENILCRITEVNCSATGLIFDGEVEIEVSICKEVQVEAEVKLEVLAKFCQPRGPITLPEQPPFVCPPRVDFPPQCDFFPVQNCDCQGSVHATNENLAVIIGTGAIPTDTGTARIDAEICPNCSLAGSTLTFQFTDTPSAPPYVEAPGDQSFTFTATQFNQPTCLLPAVGNLVLTVTGQGIVTFPNGTQQPTTFSLTLVETPLGLSDTYILTLTDFAGAQLFATVPGGVLVPDSTLIVRDCLRLPYPV